MNTAPTSPPPTPSGSSSQRPAEPAPNGHHDHTNEIKLKDPSGRLRLPAHILIALVIATAGLLLVAAGLLLAPE